MHRFFLFAVLSAALQLCKSQTTCRVKDCCSLSKNELTDCRGVHKQCPSTSTFDKILRTSCDECALGWCRLPSSAGRTDTCMCPERFMGSSIWHGRCRQSHGGEWPFSVEKQEIDRKRCAGAKYDSSGKPRLPIPSVTAAALAKCPVKDFCSLTEDQLTACRGISGKCPSTDDFGMILRTSCVECPQGLCRLPSSTGKTDSCMCPERFLGSSIWHGRCTKSHGIEWPFSARKTEIDRQTKCKNIRNGPDGRAIGPGGTPSGDPPVPSEPLSPPSTRPSTSPDSAITRTMNVLTVWEKVGIAFGVVATLGIVAGAIIAYNSRPN